MNYFWIGLSIVVAFFLGYQFCMIRHMVKETATMLQVMVDILRNSITAEEAQERIKKAIPWLEEAEEKEEEV